MKITDYKKHEITDLTNWDMGNMEKRAEYIKENLKEGEIIEADTLGEFSCGDLRNIKRCLQNFGLNDLEFKFLIYPQNQNPERMRRLFVYRK